MDFGINGKVAMVAAASKGIGLATAKALSEEGCTLSICGRNQAALDLAISQLGEASRGYLCDISKIDEIERWHKQTVTDLGVPAIVVTNTGGPPAGNVLGMTDEQWESGLQSTLMNVIRLVRLVSPGMKDKGWGRIVHVTSLVAKEPSSLLPISSTIRTGLMSLTKLQAWELAQHGITVNGVLPGHTDTDRQHHLVQMRADKDGIDFAEAKKRQAEGTAMKRFATPKEIGDAITFLCSLQASYVSGVSLLVDGATTCAFG